MLIYDIEIANCIPNPKQPKDPNLCYCKGWDDHKGMGISCIACYDYLEDRYRLFMHDNREAFEDLILTMISAGGFIIGFNSMQFDNRVIHHSGWFENLELLHIWTYDLLQEIWRAATGITGYVEEFDYTVHAGYGLDQMVRANGLTKGKTGHGAIAPIDYQQGNYGSLIDYCLADVWNTKKLFDHLLATNGRLKSPKVGETELKLHIPEEIKKWHNARV